MKSIDLSPEEVSELSRRVRLRIIHEDNDIVLTSAPNDDQLVDIIKDLLNYKPMNLKEIHYILSGIASEDKIRKALNTLISRGEVYISGNNGKYILATIS
ncbi:MAG: ArsR family transcriptional regulator [Desulfurococcaceae archaeon]|jgi:hypothetical protein|nr:ArsR family transcriptional regulator [Desulfurococcaceae archaeon]